MKPFSMCWNNFQLSVENNPGQLWFSFSSLYDWSRKLAPLSQPINFKTKSNRDSVTRVFPRFMQFASFYFDFSLAPRDIFQVLLDCCE